MSAEVLDSATEERLRELLATLSGRTAAVRMWRELMSSQERQVVLEWLPSEPPIAGLDDNPEIETCSVDQEILEGLPGRCLHGAFYRWGTLGIWRRVHPSSQPRAIIELAYQNGGLLEVEYRRLLRGIGETEGSTPPPDPRPHWNRALRELSFLGKVVRHFRSLTIAKNVVAILDAFQLEGWPVRIDNPIPGSGKLGKGGQAESHRLREAIGSLNTGLLLIKFEADGTGTGIIWRKR
ncbi:MAG: hypothetical protein AB7O62_22370 [Pirellulales bacterium]